MYELKMLTTEIFAENIYFILDRTSGHTIIVDPGAIIFDKLLNYISINQMHPVAILNTHAHPDHIARVNELQEHFQIPFFLHENEADYFEEFKQLGMMIGFENFKMPENVQYIKEGKFEFDNFKFDILHTPGHTKGSICIVLGQQMISGDTLFQDSIGRIDLPGGSMIEMNSTIERLKKLDSDLVVYPGHGEKTTIKNEIDNNPYF